MSEIIRFDTNIPVEVALKWTDGRQVKSRIEGAADQYMFTTMDGKVMYLPLHVGEQIRGLQLAPGSPVQILRGEVRNGQRKSIEWQVKRVDPDPRWQDRNGSPATPQPTTAESAIPAPVTTVGTVQQADSTRPANRTAAYQNFVPPLLSAPPPAPKPNGAPTAKPNGNSHATHNGVPYWDPKTELLRSYSEAIEVLVTAREQAASKGLPVQFTGEDLRQVAATLYIDRGKDRRTAQINGGGR